MSEGFALWSALGPVQTGLSLFVLGVVVGSFCNVIRHRVPVGVSFVWGRSECPTCGHHLKARDLVPVLSYILLRGRCRYCTLKISATYPLTELTTGLLAALAGVMQGWGAGFLALGIWVAGTFAFALLERRRPLRGESGMTLVEVLASIFVLTVALLPALDTLAVARHAGLATQKRSLVIGIARARLNHLSELAASTGIASVDSQSGGLSGEDVTGEPSLAQYMVTTGTPDAAGLPPGARRLSVTVSCPSCAGLMGEAVKPVTLTTIVRETFNAE